ncbi:MAG TPA: hypothetical protein VI756_32345, partial [Blastocatellia bacterium]
GDSRGRVPGTHYYEQSEQVVLFWHMFDQVLIRPDLIPHFRGETLQIVTKCGDTPLLTARGMPDAKAASDHLPIVFTLDL